MKGKSILILASVAFFFGSASTGFGNTANFQGLGNLPGGSFYSEAYAVSADGAVVVGRSYSGPSTEAFRWENGVMTGLGDLSGSSFISEAHAVSADGAVVVGWSRSGSGIEAFRWANGVMTGLGDFAGGDFSSKAYGVSSDGSVIVGYGWSGSGLEAFRWENGVMTGLGDFPGGYFHSRAYGVSADGSVVVGFSDSTLGDQAFRWENGVLTGLGDLPGGSFESIAHDVSADGLVVVGGGDSGLGIVEAFRWENNVMTGLGDLPGGPFFSKARGISADGSAVVGEAYTATGTKAFIWTADKGMVSLHQLLVGRGLDLTGWSLSEAWDISADGLTIVGRGVNPAGYTEAWIATIPEPATPPVADADGPYSIYVSDTLTLDANGSTDADNDIVSYMWDLDDNNSFETDAGGQAIFDVNYTYLQSLGLLIDHTYTIHLKVTDSEQQSDVADSTLTIVPKPALVVAVDIKPGSCPNPVNTKSSGVLPIAILGTDDYDVTTIDPTSIRLAGVEPLRSGYEDVAAPVSDSNDCNCITDGPDGFLDLTLKFETQRIVEAVGDVNDGDVLTLELTGVLFDPMPFETPIEGADCILIKGWHKAHNKADINKDGVVDMTDFAIISENWLQSSVVEDY